MRNRQILAVLAAVLTGAVVASLLIPAAGASPKAKASTTLCSATATKPLGNTGVVKVSVKGKGSNAAGAPVSCSGTVAGKWKKNSTTFSTGSTVSAKVNGAGFWSHPLQPLEVGTLASGKLAGKLVGSGLPAGTDITVKWGCDISYPPLKVKCYIIVSTA